MFNYSYKLSFERTSECSVKNHDVFDYVYDALVEALDNKGFLLTENFDSFVIDCDRLIEEDIIFIRALITGDGYFENIAVVEL